MAEELAAFDAVAAEVEPDMLQNFVQSDEVRNFAAGFQRAMMCAGRVALSKAQTFLGDGETPEAAWRRNLLDGEVAVARSATTVKLVEGLMKVCEKTLNEETASTTSTTASASAGGSDSFCEICLLQQGNLTQASQGKHCHNECGAWWLNRIQAAMPSNEYKSGPLG